MQKEKLRSCKNTGYTPTC